MIIYDGSGFMLSPLTIDFVSDRYLGWFYDENVTALTSHRTFPKTMKDLFDYVDGLDPRHDLVFALSEYPGGLHIGNIALQGIDWVNRSAELAFLIGDRGFHGKGAATWAGKVMLRHAFDKMHLHRVWLGTPAPHAAMLAVAKKIRMTTVEGFLRQAFWYKGQYHDIVRLSIIESEYYNGGANE